MELRVLRYFIEVAREQNITGGRRSSAHLPAGSVQTIDGVGTRTREKIFNRGKRKTTLTDDGMFLYRRAQEIVDIADKTENAFKTTDEMISGDVSIGCGETQGMRNGNQSNEKTQRYASGHTISFIQR